MAYTVRVRAALVAALGFACAHNEEVTGDHQGAADSGGDAATDTGVGSFDADADGWAAADGDCDDSDPTRSPGVTEVAGNSIDENCDGSDASPTSLELVGDRVWWGEPDEYSQGNYAGSSLCAVGDTDGDLLDYLLVTAPCGLDGCYAPAVYLLSGNILAGGALADNADAAFSWSEDSMSTYEQVGIGGGDLSGDGLADVVLTDVYWTAAGMGQLGRVAVFMAPFSGVREVAGADALVVGTEPDGGVGLGVASGDVSGDGIADLLVSNRLGATAVIYGPVDGSYAQTDADALLSGPGNPLALAGDTDGDGHLDVLFGSDGEDDERGRAYLALGPFSGMVDVTSAGASFGGEHDRDFLGQVVASAGDLNDDGLSDLVISAHGYDKDLVLDAGRSYIFLGPQAGAQSAARADLIVTGESGQSWLGNGLTDSGKWGAGAAQGLALGAPGALNPYPTEPLPGKVYLFNTALSGSVSAASATTMLVGASPGDGAGYSIARGDFDRDGIPDLAVGAPYDSEHGEHAGKVYIVSGARLPTPP